MDSKDNKKTITNDDVKYVAKLARISLSEDDTKCFQRQLSGILDYIAQLNEVDTDNTPPTTHVLSSMKNVFREDDLKESLSPDEVLKNAPERRGDFFAVPKIIKES